MRVRNLFSGLLFCFCSSLSAQSILTADGLASFASAGSSAVTYTAATFKENDGTLHVFTSSNAVTWNQLSESYQETMYVSHDSQTFTGTLRDPTIFYNNTAFFKYFCAYTINTGSCWYNRGSDANTTPAFGLAGSTDGKTWTRMLYPYYIMSMQSSGRSLWAPSWFVDPSDGSIHLIVSMDAFAGSNHYLAEMHPLDTYLTTWSDPVAIAGTWTAASMIDGFEFKKGSTYYIFYKNDARPNPYIEIATSSSPFSGFTVIKSGDWAGWGSGQVGGVNNGYEAPSVVDIGTNFRMYCDSSTSHGQWYSDIAYDLSTATSLTLGTFNNPPENYPAMSGADARVLTVPVH